MSAYFQIICEIFNSICEFLICNVSAYFHYSRISSKKILLEICNVLVYFQIICEISNSIFKTDKFYLKMLIMGHSNNIYNKKKPKNNFIYIRK